MRPILMLLGIVALAAAAPRPADAEVARPEAGTALRREILNAARPVFETDTSGPVEFTVHALAVDNDWAFGDVALRRPGGGEIDWSQTQFAEDNAQGAFDPSASFFLARHTAQGWTVIEHATGPTDAPWIEWGKTYNLSGEMLQR